MREQRMWYGYWKNKINYSNFVKYCKNSKSDRAFFKHTLKRELLSAVVLFF